MAARQVQQPSQAPFILLGGLILAGAAFYTGWPGVPAIWLALVVTAWMEPPVMLTGKKDASGYATPAGPGEERNLQRYSMWRELKWRLIVPNTDWAPGWPVLGSFIGGVVAAAAAFTIPTIDTTLRFANAGAAFLVVAVVMGVRRRTLAEDMCPGARIDSLPELAKSKPQFIVAGVVAAAAAGTAAHIFIPVWDTGSAGEGGPATTAQVDPENVLSPLVDYGTRTPLVATVSLALLAFLAAIAVPWTNKAIGHWRVVVAARKEWRPRWQALKFDPAPFLIDRQEVGVAVVDTFMAPPGQGAAAFFALVPKIQPTVGAGSRIAVLSTPNEGPEGPVPGTTHPLRFEVVNWPMGGFPDFAEPEIDPEVVALGARCAFSWGVDVTGVARPVLLGIEPVHAPGSPASAWESKWAWPGGPGLTTIRSTYLGDVAASFECETLIDHRRDSLFFGGLITGAPEEWQDSGTIAFPEIFERLKREDDWNYRWSQVLKQGAQAPVPEHSTASSALLADGTEVFRQAFTTRMGVDPREFATSGMEKKIATSLVGVPFCTVGGWNQSSDRAGERHSQAIAVYWCPSPVPTSPQTLAPTSASRGMKATDWVLVGHINKAFDGARLPRPEIASSTCLTDPEARRGHIWEIKLRLHDGVTLSDVRGAVGRLKSSLGVNWLRVAPDDIGCVLFAGANPRDTKLLRPAKDIRRLKGLDWEQAWLDSGVSGVGGILPKLAAASVLPSNEQVEVLDFKLPTGVDMATVKNAVSKLMASTNNAFIEVRPGPDASTARLLVCPINPLPERVGYDFEAIDQSDKIPFATGVEGEPIEFDHTESPHALLAGMTGAGKSVMAQAFLYGAIVRGWDCYVIDPVKGGADFVFAKDRCRAFAATPFEAAGVMKAVYDDVIQRKTMNAAHGVGSIDELPEDIRPPHVFVFIDEFTSLMGRSLVPKSDDPSMQSEIEMIEAENHARTEIGVYAGKIAREARSAGVHLGLGTQKLTAKMLDTIPGAGDLKTNLARTLLGKGSFGDRASALRAPDDAPRLEGEVPKGRGLWEPLSSPAMVVQTWFEKQDRLRAELVERVPELEQDRYIDLSQFTPSSEDDIVPVPMPVSAPVADQVIELEGLELSLDDLELSLDDLDAYDDTDDEDTDDEDDTGSLDGDAVQSGPVNGHLSEEDIFGGGIELVEGSVEPAVGIDELDWDIDDEIMESLDPRPDPDPVSVPETFTRALSRPDTVVFLDVDGVLFPHQDPPPSTWDDWVPINQPSFDYDHGSPAMCRRIADSGANLVWLTSWEGDMANSSFARLLGGPLAALDRGAAAYGWWKIDAALAWLNDHPEIRRVVWFDDDLEDIDDDGVHRCDTMSTMLEMLDIEHLLIAPKISEGISPDNLFEMEEWLEESEPHTAPPTETPSSDQSASNGQAVDDDDDPFAGPAWEIPVDHDNPFV